MGGKPFKNGAGTCENAAKHAHVTDDYIEAK